jgi:hypothetical protein
MLSTRSREQLLREEMAKNILGWGMRLTWEVRHYNKKLVERHNEKVDNDDDDTYGNTPTDRAKDAFHCNLRRFTTSSHCFRIDRCLVAKGCPW